MFRFCLLLCLCQAIMYCTNDDITVSQTGKNGE